MPAPYKDFLPHVSSFAKQSHDDIYIYIYIYIYTTNTNNIYIYIYIYISLFPCRGDLPVGHLLVVSIHPVGESEGLGLRRGRVEGGRGAVPSDVLVALV